MKMETALLSISLASAIVVLVAPDIDFSRSINADPSANIHTYKHKPPMAILVHK